MKLAVISLDEPWVIRERSILARDIEALPRVIRSLVDELVSYGEGANQQSR